MLDDHPGIDGIVAIVHGTGCGHAAYGEGFDVLRRTQWGYASHPNFAGVVMVGLGCEVFQIGRMKKEYGLSETDTFRTMTIQETGGTKKTVEAISAAIRDMLPIAARAHRETRPASEIVLALQCGGSDGYSGLTANPALGAASDLLVRHGGASILSETPEIYGAEHLLTRRAATREVGEKLVERLRRGRRQRLQRTRMQGPNLLVGEAREQRAAGGASKAREAMTDRCDDPERPGARVMGYAHDVAPVAHAHIAGVAESDGKFGYHRIGAGDHGRGAAKEPAHLEHERAGPKMLRRSHRLEQARVSHGPKQAGDAALRHRGQRRDVGDRQLGPLRRETTEHGGSARERRHDGFQKLQLELHIAQP